MAELSTRLWLSQDESPHSFPYLEKLFSVTIDDHNQSRYSRKLKIIDYHAFRTGRDGERQIGLPIYKGLEIVTDYDVEIQEMLSYGKAIEVSKLPNPHHKLAPKGQDKFFDALMTEVEKKEVVLVKADTGVGKTVAALNMIGNLKRSAVVIVPKVAIGVQWEESAIRFLGMDKSRIGWLGGKSGINWKNKDLVIGVINTVSSGKIPVECRRAFGIAIFDEVHRTGAPMMSKAIGIFNAFYKVALTATVERLDKCECIYLDHYGPPAVTAEVKPLPVSFIALDFTLPRGWDHGEYTEVVSRFTFLDKRNEFLVKLIKEEYDSGENVLAFGNALEHLFLLEDMLIETGVDPKDIGQFNRVDREGRVQTREQLADAQDCRITLTTYTMSREGVDMPRKTCGVEITPCGSGSIVQCMGRVRRRFEKKQKGKWFAIRDVGCGAMEGSFRKKIRELKKHSQGVTVYE